MSDKKRDGLDVLVRRAFDAAIVEAPAPGVVTDPARAVEMIRAAVEQREAKLHGALAEILRIMRSDFRPTPGPPMGWGEFGSSIMRVLANAPFESDYVSGDVACGHAFDLGRELGRFEMLHSGSWGVLRDTLMETEGRFHPIALALLDELGLPANVNPYTARLKMLRQALRAGINHLATEGGSSTAAFRQMTQAFDATSRDTPPEQAPTLLERLQEEAHADPALLDVMTALASQEPPQAEFILTDRQDLAGAAGPSLSANSLDLHAWPQLARRGGRPVLVEARVQVTENFRARGGLTLQCEIIVAADAALTEDVTVLAATAAIPRQSLVAGYQFRMHLPGQELLGRYAGFRFTTAGSDVITGSVSAWLRPGQAAARLTATEVALREAEGTMQAHHETDVFDRNREAAGLSPWAGSLMARCREPGCGGFLGPSGTGMPMCYRCGPRAMLPSQMGNSIENPLPVRPGSAWPAAARYAQAAVVSRGGGGVVIDAHDIRPLGVHALVDDELGEHAACGTPGTVARPGSGRRVTCPRCRALAETRG